MLSFTQRLWRHLRTPRAPTWLDPATLPALQELYHAVRHHTTQEWALRHPTYGPYMDSTQAQADAQAAQLIAPHIDTHAWSVLRHHPIRTLFTTEPLLAYAVRRGAHPMIPLLVGEYWSDYACFSNTLLTTLDMRPTDADLQSDAAMVLAQMADRLIARGEWEAYARAIAKALRAGHVGVVPWAVRENLPIYGCLPVREHMFSLYNTGTNEACFRLSSFLARANTAHQSVSFHQMLALAGGHPARALFSPNPAFVHACRQLPFSPE